jgi:hypothetical protein
VLEVKAYDTPSDYLSFDGGEGSIRTEDGRVIALRGPIHRKIDISTKR